VFCFQSKQGASTDMALHIAIEDPAQPEIVDLLRDGEEHSAKLYPAESNHHLPVDALRSSNVRFFVARDRSGRAVGTGALVLFGPWAELKRMWVVPDARGRGVSKAILVALEAEARSEHVTILKLETGVENLAALGLYTLAGFRLRGPFGDYRADPLSVFMEKRLSEHLG
jgi:putative acetyltransferase